MKKTNRDSKTLLEQQKAKITVSSLPLFVSIPLFFQASFDQRPTSCHVQDFSYHHLHPVNSKPQGLLHLRFSASFVDQSPLDNGHVIVPPMDHLRRAFYLPPSTTAIASKDRGPNCPWLILSQLLCVFVIFPPFSAIVSCPR